MGRTVNPLAYAYGGSNPSLSTISFKKQIRSMAEPNTTCEACDNAYYIKPGRLSISRFCSRTCKDSSGSLAQSTLVSLYYDQHYSMQEIAAELGCSPHKVVYWMDQYGLERRDWSEATYVKNNPDGDPFTIYEPHTSDEWMLFGLGLGLYMGEGTKTGKCNIVMTNTNPHIHRIFIQFLKVFCGVSSSQLRCWINIFDDVSAQIATKWWCHQLALSEDQFFKPTIREQKQGTYTRKSQHGTISVCFSNTKLKQILEEWCEKYYNQYE